MIDGVINNGRRGEELEKAQEYAERTTPEKPSIRDKVDTGFCGDQALALAFHKSGCHQLFDDCRPGRKKELTKKMATDLLKKGRTNVKGMWSEKKQAAYDAAVILDDTGGKYINFKLEFPKRKVGADGRK
jgi:hypothetical protein